jgi:hypothetical protein
LIALDRVLFSHQHGLPCESLEVFPLKRLVIGEGMPMNVQSSRSQLVEKALRIADAGHRMHRCARKL